MPSSFLTPATAKRTASSLSYNLFSSWTQLRKILDRHEATIRKRWSKKNRGQRQKLLFSVLPTMPVSHRPDFQAFRDSERPSPNSRDAFLRPYINVEDLIQGHLFLLFVNSRGRYPPNAFAHADFEASHLAIASGRVMPGFLNEYTMYLEKDNPDDYGKMVSWDDDADAFDHMFRGSAFQPGEGIQILEIQKGVMDFLLSCCESILQDIPNLFSEEFMVQPEPPALIGDPNEWPTLATIRAEAPYRIPANLDFNQLVAVLAGRRSAAEDHIWALREDPGYFFDYLVNRSEHRLEKIIDTNGRQHSHINDDIFWARVFGSSITDAYGSLIVFDYLEKQAIELARFQKKYGSRLIDNEGPWVARREFMKAMYLFRHSLKQASHGPIANLRMAVGSSPLMRSEWVRRPAIEGSTKLSAHKKTHDPKDFLIWAIQTLFDDNALFLARLSDLMDELERFIQCNKSEKARLSDHVLDLLSNLGLFGAMMHQISLYQPLESQAAMEFEDEVSNDYLKGVELLNQIEELEDRDLCALKLGDPFEGRYAWPSGKRRTQENVETMRKSEQNLDCFWQKIDGHVKEKTGKTLNGIVDKLLRTNRTLQRTPEWVPPVQETKKQVPEADFTDFSKSLSELSMAPGAKAEYGVQKTKTKTRGVPDGRQMEVLPVDGISPYQIPDVQPTFTLGKRAHKVLTTLFYEPGEHDQPGEIPWSDFLHAMAAVGFGPVKLHGSVWQFTPTALDVERSIQFHEPHPRKKIPFTTARRIGRRLNRAYGWHTEMFLLAE